MPGPTLADIAADLEAQAQKLLDEGQGDAAARVALAACAAYRGVTGLLTAGKYSPKIAAMAMDTEHREAISKGRSKGNPMLRLAREKGYARAEELCEALVAAAKADKVQLRVSPSMLSQVVAKTKKLPPDLGKYLKQVIGWEP